MPRLASPEKAPSQKQITAVAESVIAEHGLKSALPMLLHTVEVMNAISLADHENREKELQAMRWMRAAKAVVMPYRQSAHSNKQPATFEQLIGERDAIAARGMGIRLD